MLFFESRFGLLYGILYGKNIHVNIKIKSGINLLYGYKTTGF
jgi:hypothetical protein